MNNDEYILDLFHKSNSVYGSLRPLQNLFFYTISGESNFLSNIKSLNSNIAKPRVTDEISSLTTSAINSIVIDVSGSNPYSAIVNINYNDPGITATNRLGVSLTVDVSSNVNSTVLGEYIVEYIITSADNLFRTRYFRTVYIVDTVSPIITILGSNPLIIEVYGDLTGIEFGATATDNFDSIVNVTQVSNLDISNTGTYEIVYSVSDSNGNDMSAVRIINVVDTTSPFITISGDNPSTFEVYTVYVDAGATATDNYDQSVSVVTTGSVDISTVGQYTLTYNATDACGNQATPKTRIVNVVDTTSPFITISGDNPATFEVYTVYVDAGATATDNYDQSVSVVTTGSVDISTVGQYTLTYNATDACGNQATPKTRIVNIVDIISPTHSLLGDNPLVWTMTQTYVDPGYDASDNYDVSLTVVVETNLNINVVGSYYYKYIFTDDYSNSANVTRTVYVIDYSVIHNIPVINIAEDSSMNILNILNQMTNSNYLKNTNLLADRFAIDFANKDESYILPFDTYKTLYSGDNNIVIFAHGFSNETIELVDAQSNAVGNYKYPYITSEINIKSMVNIVFDNSLNCKVVVLDGKHSDLTDYFVPNITLTGNNPTTIEVNSTFNVSQLEQAASAVDYQNNNITSTMQVYNNLDITTVGVYEMLYVATDPSGYQVTKLRTLKVVDTTLPVITMVTVSGDVNILWDVYNTFVDPGFSVSDNYDLSLSAADVVVTGTVDISSLGLNTLTYNVSDVYGNAAITKTRIVSVVDREPPVIVIDGSASLNHILNTSYIDAGVTITDNYFSLEQLTIDTSNNVDINVVGTYKVIYNATDPCGNAALPKERTVSVYNPTALSGLIPTVVDYQIPKYYTLAPSNQIYSMGSEYYKAYCVPTSFASVLNYYNEIQGLNIQLNYTSLNSMAPETDYMFNFNNRLAGVTGVTDPAKIDLGYYFNTNAQGFDLSSGSYVGTRLKDFNKFVDFMTVISPSAQYHYYYKGLNNSIAYTNISGATETPYSANDITTNVILSDISANISTAKPVILSFLHWNIIDSGATVNVDGTHINLYNFSGYSPTPDVGLPIYAANPELIEEVWTNENSETNLGHTVVCVGYIENYNGKNWIIVQDNVSQPSDPNLTHRYVGIELDYTVLIMCTFMDFTPQAGNPVNNIVVSSNISPLPEGFNSSLRIYDTSLLDISQQFIINDNQNLDDISNNVAVYMVNDGLYIECASGNVYDGLNLVSVMVDVCLNDIKQSATTDFSFTIVNDLSGKYQLVNAVEPELEYLFITSSSTDYSVDANFMDISSGPLLLGTFSF